MATVTLLAIYPLSLGCGAVLGLLLAPLPKPVSGLAISVVLIAAMTCVVMPRATRMFKWLYPTA